MEELRINTSPATGMSALYEYHGNCTGKAPHGVSDCYRAVNSIHIYVLQRVEKYSFKTSHSFTFYCVLIGVRGSVVG
jgi:hypothetical protein